MMKITLPKNKFSDLIIELSNSIVGTKWENNVFCCGGTVRDIIMGNQVKDIDLCIESDNGALDFSKWICDEYNCYRPNSNPVTFERFGTVKFNIKTIKLFEDIDVECIHTRKSDNLMLTECGTLNEDVEYRDFTINGLYLNISDMTVIDPTGKGIDDITKMIIRCIDKDKTFKQDPLRMLRAIRFSSQFNFDIDKDTWISIVLNSHTISTIKSERIREEFNKILLTDKPSVGLSKLYYSGLLRHIMFELYQTAGVSQGIQHDSDVFSHILSVIDKTPDNIISRMGALMHDIGKPRVRVKILDKIHFYGHEIEGADMAINILKRMKYSNTFISSVVDIVKSHMKLKHIGDRCPKDKYIRALMNRYPNNIENILDVIHADNMSNRSEYNFPNQIPLLRERMRDIIEMNNEPKVKLPINGNDIMAHFNISKGPKVGELIKAIKNKLFEKPDMTKDECLRYLDNYVKKST